jgi:hypothetical protein
MNPTQKRFSLTGVRLKKGNSYQSEEAVHNRSNQIERMKKLFASLAIAALAGIANADITHLFPNGDFDHPAGTNTPWVEVGGGTTWSYPTTGGNPGGYGVMNGTGGWGIWVGGNTTPLPIAPMGLVAGNTYNFVQDMMSIVDNGGGNSVRVASSATAGT